MKTGILPPPVSDSLAIGLRTYAVAEGRANRSIKPAKKRRGPSKWNLVFDTETTTDPSQRLRFGCYQLYEADTLRDSGLFFDREALSRDEVETLQRYALAKRLNLWTLAEFVEKVFLRFGYHCQGTIIGFNLPFDISRIASGHAPARGRMRGGFSFSLSPDRNAPRVRIKHLSRRVSPMDFSGAGQRRPRGMRKRDIDVPRRRPAFVDVHTLAAALLGRTFSLAGLAETLETTHRKLDTDEHGRSLTPEYLDYAVQDVQVTWECYVELRRRYQLHGLTRTPVHHVFSEASIGKGYLRQMGVRSWREVQPDFPSDLIGVIMSTYYGGRSEVHLRRVIRQVAYCDFLSMYPTVCTLMGLWRFVIAKGMSHRDATEEVRKFLERVTVADLQSPSTWRRLHVLVRVKPNGDILPVRARYGGDPQFTIGLNHLTSKDPLWYTLADCIAAKLLGGRSPEVVHAIAFDPVGVQDGLKAVAIAGNPDYRVDPAIDDFYRRLIELRMQVKKREKAATGLEAQQCRTEQTALKIVANATSYGIFMQINVEEQDEVMTLRCYPATGPGFLVDMDHAEVPGDFFHPLLGTLITGAARLMLATTERLILDTGLDWALCDTDSMAVAKPADMPDAVFVDKVRAIQNWFAPLNPYAAKVDVLKIEDANFHVADGRPTGTMEPLYCFAVSSKRYALFNIRKDDQPLLRKASAHGLGHLLPPYRNEEGPAALPAPTLPLTDIGVERWQHDVWLCIIRAALTGHSHRSDFRMLPKFDSPAVSRYAATTPHLLRWFDRYNEGRSYPDQVRPFNFLLTFQTDQLSLLDDWNDDCRAGIANRRRAGVSVRLPRIAAPYHSDPALAASECFERDSGCKATSVHLKSYSEALAQYALHREAKFLNADCLDSGPAQRRHVQACTTTYVGKEANRWEEQSYIGLDPALEITYGMAPQDRGAAMETLRAAANAHGQRRLAQAGGVSLQHLSAILLGKATPSEKMLQKLAGAAAAVEREEWLHDRVAADMREKVAERCSRVGLRTFAASAKIDPGHLTRIITKKRRMTPAVLAKLEHGLHQSAYS